MEAKDTILTQGELVATSIYVYLDETTLFSARRVAEAQAEATWKVAFEEGRKTGYKQGYEQRERIYGL